MAGLAPVELTADCEHCGLEAGVVEVYDALVPACRFGLPASTRCKLCAASTEGVVDRPAPKAMREIAANRCPACVKELSPSAIDERACLACGAKAFLQASSEPHRFSTIDELQEVLDAWALREEFPSRDALAAATFADPDIGNLFRRLLAKERIEAIADPFANMGVRTAGSAGAARTTPPVEKRQANLATGNPEPVVIARRSPPMTELPNMTQPLAPPLVMRSSPPVIAEAPPPSAPPRAIVFPLVSVVAADGEIHPLERALIDRFLQSEGLPPLAESEFCVHHPSEVAHLVPVERREDVVKLMCESASVDGMPDESERRVIRAYATAWNVDDEKLDFWMWGYETMNTSLTRGLWLKLRRFVLSARWSEAESQSLPETRDPG